VGSRKQTLSGYPRGPSAATAASVKVQSLSSEDLARRVVERRAVEAVIWGMPAVNAEMMFQAVRDAKADFNQIVYWSRPISWKNQTLTPNPDTILFHALAMRFAIISAPHGLYRSRFTNIASCHEVGLSANLLREGLPQKVTAQCIPGSAHPCC
jgi:hypothetical protein